MDTYGDMVTLLLTFFVLLFAFSSVDDAKWNILVQAFTGSPPMRSLAAVDMLNEPDMTEHLPQTYVNLRDMNTGGQTEEEAEALFGLTMDNLTPEELEKLSIYMSDQQREIMSSPEYQENEERFSLLYERLTVYIEKNGLENMLFAERDMESIYLRVAAGVLFESGRADIREEAKPVLDTLEDIFYTASDSLSMVSVEGHTDSVPIHNAQFADNWELSSARATRVGRYIWEKGRIGQEKFSVSGYGEFRPIATNETEEGKQANRRVEFVLRKKILTSQDIEKLDTEGEPPTLDVAEDPSQAASAMPEAIQNQAPENDPANNTQEAGA